VIKILHTEWSDGWGGQEIRIINEMLAIKAQGVEVFLACREHAVIREKAIKNDIPVFSLPFRGNLDLITLGLLFRLIKRFHIDIINTHSGKDTWVGGLAARLSGAIFIRTRHLSNPIRSSRTNFINELAHFIFTTGESVRTDMIRNNRIKPERIMSIPTGIDADRFSRANFNRVECKQSLGLADDDLVVGIVAVLRRFKRHDLLIEAMTRLFSEYSALKLVIAGDGPIRELIENDIQQRGLGDRVIMTGHVNDPERVLAALDIFVLSSDSKEGVPQSVMQALLMDLPVVATNAGSTADLLHDDNFVLVDAGDADALYQGLKVVIESRELRDGYASRARPYIYKNYSEPVMAEKIMKVYSDLTGKTI
jgi:glycosyltransferase involved in cell wall biosynthesis